ncbi:class I SAM-dependent RNA methyltransferase [bacterium]|nr:class I SAM-dependent RNA methyltransferase [bacterium]
MQYHLIATCSLGLEAVVARELNNLGMSNVRSDNGQIHFEADEFGLAKSNIWLRSADRVWWLVKSFPCHTFEELFQGMKTIPWGEIIPVNGRFPVDAHSHNSTLTSLPAIQRTAKKAAVEVMQNKYRRLVFTEDGSAHYPIKVFLVKDVCSIMVDTSGSGLHRRGYRTLNAAAPLRETLASALVQLSYWNKDRLLIDPFCGSGTICLEAAMLGLNMAPGLTRKFAYETWPIIEERVCKMALQEAQDTFDRHSKLNIQGYDNDPQVLKLANFHLQKVGLQGRGITFNLRDIAQFQSDEEYGIIITNPPYGERLLEREEAEELYKVLGNIKRGLPTWSVYSISSDPQFEKYFGQQAKRKRKVYNGMIACNYFQYPGPPKKFTQNRVF